MSSTDLPGREATVDEIIGKKREPYLFPGMTSWDESATNRPVQEPFKWPQPTFVDDLIARAPRGKTQLEKEAWAKEVSESMKVYYAQVRMLNLEHMANQGRMEEYIQKQAMEAGGLDDKAKLAMFDQSIDVTTNRTPQITSAQNKFLDQYLSGGDEGLAKEASRIKAYRDERVQFNRMSEMDVGLMASTAKEAVETEKNRWITRGGMLSAGEGLTFGPIAGNPVERILAQIGDVANQSTEEWRKKRERSPNKERYGDPETYRRFLRGTGLKLIQEDLKDPKLEESFIEGGLRYLGGIASPFIGAKALQGVGMLARQAPKLKKLLTVGTAGGIGATIAAHGPDEAQRVVIDKQADEEKWTKEQRDRAYTAASALNGVMGATFLPVFTYVSTFGEGSKSIIKRIAAPAAGLTVAGELHTKAVDWMRGIAESAAPAGSEMEKTLDMMLLTNPKLAGPLERLATGKGAVEGEPGDRWQAAKDVAQQLLPNMVFFGGIQAVRAAVPQLAKGIIKKEHVLGAKEEVKTHLTGDARDMALKDLAEIEEQLPKQTAKEQLVGELGSEKANEAIRAEIERERVERAEKERPMRGVEPVGRAAEDAARGEQLRLEAAERRMRGGEPAGRAAEDEEIRLAQERELTPEQEDAAAYRQMADQAEGPEAVALRDIARLHEQRDKDVAAGKEPTPMPQAMEEAVKASDEKALSEAVEAPKQEEAAAKRLLDGGLAKKELSERAKKLKSAVQHRLSGHDRRQRGIRRRAAEGSGIDIILDAGGLHPNLVSREMGMHLFKDLQKLRPGLVSKKGINDLGRLAEVLKSRGIIHVDPSMPDFHEQNYRLAQEWLQGVMANPKGRHGPENLAEMAKEMEDDLARTEHEHRLSEEEELRLEEEGERESVKAEAEFEGLVQEGDIFDTPSGEITVEKVKPGLIEARDADGALVTRTPGELAEEAPTLVGRRRMLAEKLASQRQAEKAAKDQAKEESRQAKIERAAHKAQRGTPEEKEAAKQEMNEEIVANDEEIAQQDAEARQAKSSEVDAPPPGEDEVPEAAKKSVSFAKKVQASGLLKRLADSKDWSKLKAGEDDNDASRSVLETAKQREQVYPKDLTGEERAAQALYDHLRISEGLPPAAETVKAHIGRLNADLKKLDKMKGHDLWRGLQAIFERHHDFIKGPWHSVARGMVDGVAAMNKLEHAITRLNGEVIKKPGERGAALIPGSKDIEEAGRILKLVRATWPWSTEHGLNPNFYSLSPRANMQLVDEITRRFMADPSPDMEGQPWLERTLQGMGMAFGAPEVRFGKIGVLAAHMLSRAQAQTIKHLRDLIDKKFGLVSGLTMEQRRMLYDVAEKDPSEWSKMTSDKTVLERAPRFQALNKHFGDILWDSSDVKYHLEHDIRILRDQSKRASESQAFAESRGGQFKADERAKKVNAKLLAAEKMLAKEEKAWKVRNFVHHVAEGMLMTGGDFTITYHRQAQAELAKKGFEPVHDALASAVDYGPKAIMVVEKRRFLRGTFEFLNGKLRMVEWKDIAGSTADGRTRAIHDGEDMAILGEHYVLEGGDGKRQLLPTRKEVNGEWVNVEAPEGATRMVVLAPYDGIPRRLVDYYRVKGEDGKEKRVPTGKFEGGKWVETPPPKGAERVTYREVKHVSDRYLGKKTEDSSKWKLLHPNDAMSELSIRDGGWFERASPKRGDDMEQFLAKAYRGLDELRLNQTPAQGIFSALGRFSTKMAMTSPSTAMNIATGGSLMNTLHMDVSTQAWATKQIATLLYRRFGKGVGETLPGAEPGTPDYDVGRRGLRTSPEEMAKLSPKDAVEQGYADDSMVDLSNSGLLEHTMVDLEKKLNIPGTEGLTEEAVRKATGMQFWDYVLYHVRGADAFARIQNYLGVSYQARKAGLSRKEAHAKASTSVIFNHGLFNALTQSPLLASSYGQFFLGLKTYLARQFMVWAAAPAQYKVKYASLVIATNYIWQQMGLGDLTSTLGTSLYDLPFGVGDWFSDFVLGGEEPLGPDTMAKPGLIPVQTPFTASPMAGAVTTAAQMLMAFKEGSTEKGQQLAARALDQAFMPAVVKMANRAMAKPNAEGTYDAISIPQRVAGDDRTSYTLKQTGLHQVGLDLLPGSQYDVQRSIEDRRIKQAQKKSLESARAGVRTGVKGVLRRYDEATETNTMTPKLKESGEAEFAKLSERGRKLGLNLEDTDVRKRVFKEERRNIQIDKLPPELRAIAKGSSKESQVRMLTDALNSGISDTRLGTLRDVMAPGKSLRTWGLDVETVSESTATKFVEAIERWQARSTAPSAAAKR